MSMKLYTHPLSGHSHRTVLFASLIGAPVEIVVVDLMKGEHKRPEFLALNRFGQVPVLVDGERVIADSNHFGLPGPQERPRGLAPDDA